MKEGKNASAISKSMPTQQALEEEIRYRNYRHRYYATIRNIIYILLVIAATAVLIATLVMPIFRIYGNSMSPTLQEGEMIAEIKTENLKQGDLVAFYFSNKILIKRVIATEGQTVSIDKSGNVYVDNVLLNEPYVRNKSIGQCDIEMPYRVPEGRFFVMGDSREDSVDSRVTALGCVTGEQIAGKLIMRIWPFESIGFLGAN